MEIRYAAWDGIPGPGRVYAGAWKEACQGTVPQEFFHSLTAFCGEGRCREALDFARQPVRTVRYRMPL